MPAASFLIPTVKYTCLYFGSGCKYLSLALREVPRPGNEWGQHSTLLSQCPVG